MFFNIINEVKNGKSNSIDIQSIDVIQCFDKLNFSETHNDLWDAKIKDNRFSLIANLDRKCRAVIKTPVGESKPFTLSDIVMQGSVFGSLKCTVQVDTLGRDCLSSEDEIGLFQYKSVVYIPPTSFVDDVLGVSNCGIEAKELNSVINSKMETKNLSLGPDKCAKLHISKKGKEKCSNELKVHNEPMMNKEQIKFLGDILNSEGTIDDTILDRSSRAIGLRSQLKSIITSLSLGSFYFEISLIFRESMYLNSILVNSEAWYNISKKNMEILESADLAFFRLIFNSHSKTARESFPLRQAS